MRSYEFVLIVSDEGGFHDIDSYSANFIDPLKVNKTEYFTDDLRILIRPAQPGALKGWSPDVVILEEDVSEELYDEYVMPMVAKTDGIVLDMS